MGTPEQLLDDNFNRHIQALAAQTAGMNVWTNDGITVVNAQLPSDTFNIVHIQNTSQPGFDTLKTVVAYTKESGLPFCFWLSEAAATETTRRHLQELGAVCVGSDPGMILALDAYCPIENSDHTAIRVVKNRENLAEFASIIARNWTPPDHQVEIYYQRVAATLLNSPQNVFLVYDWEGQPVSVLELFPSDPQTVGIYSLATLQAFRGQGIGTALMRQALNYAKQAGYKTALLQSSEDGFRIYQKFGFRAITTYYEYQLA
ncbi:GNAT family N-acetyltransferase [Larkinella sp.]|uniref:GNAT family N-acetyltransferase n=1 Tax=Larkinella sp. TaxID=2034517 RepID=UPI003BA92049